MRGGRTFLLVLVFFVVGYLVYLTEEALNVSDIVTVAANAGWDATDLIVAVAVALAESGGNPRAYNPETAANTPQNEGSYGLWQVYLKVHPEFAGQNLYDPQTNANAAYQIWSRSGWKAWSTYKNGAYEAHLSSATTAVNA